MDFEALLAELFDAETMPDDARTRLTDAYAFDRGSYADELAARDATIETLNAQIDELKAANRAMLNEGGSDPKPNEAEDEEAVTIDDLFEN